jgi:hypothetical protein
MKLLNEAWHVLGNSTLRAEHDQWIARQEAIEDAIDEALREVKHPATPQQGAEYRDYPRPQAEGAKERSTDQRRNDETVSAVAEKSPLMRLNDWLGTARGIAAVLGSMATIALGIWFWPANSDRWTRSVSHSSPTPAEEHESGEKSKSSGSDTSPTPQQEYDARVAALNAQAVVPSQATSGQTPIRIQDRNTGNEASNGWNAGDPLIEPAGTRWSPNGRPWPNSAAYLKGLGPQRATGGLSKLTVDNTNGGADVYVKLCSYGLGRCDGLRHVFIPQGSSFTMNGIARGTYDIRYRSLNSGRLSRSESMQLRQVEEDGGIRYSTVTVTLYTVHDGNSRFTAISEDEF